MDLKEIAALDEALRLGRRIVRGVPGGAVTIPDELRPGVELRVTRFASLRDYEIFNPYSITRDGKAMFRDGLATDQGSAYLWRMAMTPYNAAPGANQPTLDENNAWIQVGSSSTAAAVGDTDIGAAITPPTRGRVVMDGGWPKFGTCQTNGNTGFGGANVGTRGPIASAITGTSITAIGATTMNIVDKALLAASGSIVTPAQPTAAPTATNVITYTGISSNLVAGSAWQLTGIPASGNGSITVAVPASSTISQWVSGTPRNEQSGQFQATFTSANGNGSWNEFAVIAAHAINDAPQGWPTPLSNPGSAGLSIILDHLISAQGTKASGQVWQVQISIAIA
ncbi:MAG: hypothetical protein ACYDAY_11470 [Candidatus Dormibacteria bacterium]